MADDKENFVRMTRAATKRKASMAAIIEDERLGKKRVVLGELPNLSNISAIPNQTKNPRKSGRVPRKQQKKKVISKAETTTEEPNIDIDIDTRSDDPQMCAPYVTGIFEYLRQMEVKLKQEPSFSVLSIRNLIWVSCVIAIPEAIRFGVSLLLRHSIE